MREGSPLNAIAIHRRSKPLGRWSVREAVAAPSRHRQRSTARPRRQRRRDKLGEARLLFHDSRLQSALRPGPAHSLRSVWDFLISPSWFFLEEPHAKVYVHIQSQDSGRPVSAWFGDGTSGSKEIEDVLKA
ncbi:hypothetical protein Cni_G11378 [Canna indica]|uniref:Uncharacterized protein n=1 Tax=Canna indica TaxID=4628 RepID=A0AAQ3K7P6_9LILI|nr:hypothetical protein Cni_G11378 [Canna indica]